LRPTNFFQYAHPGPDDEAIEQLVDQRDVRVERIVSRGRPSQPGGWYDQEEDEWVMLLAGGARLLFEGSDEPLVLEPGDYLEIPAHARHRVEWTDSDQETVWLAVFYRSSERRKAERRRSERRRRKEVDD
jgi:cupin 2 domain-containing protein